MADVAELLVLLSGDSAGAKRAISDTKGGLTGLGAEGTHTSGIFSKLGHIIVGAMAVAGTAALAAAASGVHAYVEISGAQSKLTAAMKSAGPQWTQSQSAIDKTVASLNNMGVGSADVLAGMTKLTEAHVPLKDQALALAAAQNFAVASGQSFSSSLQAILMASQGAGRGLKQYGINLPIPITTTKALATATTKVATEQLKMTAAEKKYGDNSSQAVAARAALTTAQDNLTAAQASYNDKFAALPGLADQVNQRFGGQAAAWQKTLPGVLNQLKIKWEDMAYSIGKVLVPYLIAFGNWIIQIEPTVAGFASGVLTVFLAVLGDIGKAIGFIVQHKTEFAVLAGVVAGIFVIGHAKAWAEDALTNIRNVFKAITNAPSMIGQFFGFGGKGAAGATSPISELEPQKVFVTNWGMMGGGKGGLPKTTFANPIGTAAGDVAPAAEGAGGAGLLATITGSSAFAGAVAAGAVLVGAAAVGVMAVTAWDAVTNIAGNRKYAEAANAKGQGLGTGGAGTGRGNAENIAQHGTSGMRADAAAAARAQALIAIRAGQVADQWLALKDDAVGTSQEWQTWRSDMTPLLQKTLTAGSNIQQAESDIAALMQAHKITNAAQLAQYETDWNSIQLKASDAAQAQALFADEVATGQLNLATQGPAFTAAWNALVKQGVNPAAISAIEIAQQMALAADVAKLLHTNLQSSNATIQAALASGVKIGTARATASGGFFEHPTNLLVGESGPETVLNRHQFQAMMAGAPPRAGGAGGGAAPTISPTYIFQGVDGKTRAMIREEIDAANSHLVHLVSAAR